MKLTYEQSLENFKKAFSVSGEMANQASDVIPGSYSRRTFNYGPHPIYVQRGEAQYIYTVEGKKLLDLNNNFTVNILGTNNEEVNKAIQNCLKDGYSFGNPSISEENLARLICSRVESVDKVKFFCSASEACLGAARIARAYTGKSKIAKMEGGYHGFCDDLAISAHSDPKNASLDLENIVCLPDSDGIPQYKVDNIILLTQNNFEICEKVLRKHADEIACVYMELQSLGGGLIILEKEFVKKMRDLTKELNIVLIFDETVTLRAAKGGLQARYGVKPDLTISGKTIGGGLPLGMVGGSNEVMSVVENEQVKISGTHHGHKLACEAGIACLNVLNDEAYAHLDRLSERVKSELNEWAKVNNYPFYIFGDFSVLGYIFTDKVGERMKTHRDYWVTDEEKMQIYALEIATKGFFPILRGQIALTLPMTDEDITGLIEATKDIVERIYED